MVNSHCTGTVPGMGQGLERGSVGSNIYMGQKCSHWSMTGTEIGTNISYCGRVLFSVTVPVPFLCNENKTGLKHNCGGVVITVRLLTGTKSILQN